MRIETRHVELRADWQTDQATPAVRGQLHNASGDSQLVTLGWDSLATLPEAAILRFATLEVRLGPLLRSDASSQAASSPPTTDSSDLPDILSYLRIPDGHPPAGSLARAQLERRLQNAFEHEPLEDGIRHAAEAIIRGSLQSPHRRDVLEWLRSFALDKEDPLFAASTLRCLARVRSLGVPDWRARLIQAGLMMDNIEMRDAAIQAAETWGGKEILGVLQAHTESNSWLRSYVEDVISDLSE